MSKLEDVQIGSQIAHVSRWPELCHAVADEIEALIRDRAAQGQFAVLGLATGSTPLDLYAELVRRHQEEGLSFANVVSFNLDEYEGLGRDHPKSYWAEMWTNLFRHVDIDPSRVHVPPSIFDDAQQAALDYEQKIVAAGGIDWQLLGIGRAGHIGFNEVGSTKDTRTRQVSLARETIEDATPGFVSYGEVPTRAMTMGVATILESKRIVLMAKGSGKKKIVQLAMSGAPSEAVPASFLQLHKNVGWFLGPGIAGSQRDDDQ